MRETAERESLRQVATFELPLHRRMEVLGRPDESVCGMGVFVTPAAPLRGGPVR
jgi:hypothetical protein